MQKKIIVITGATSGIGAGIARGLAAHAIELVLIGRNPARGKIIADELTRASGNPRVSYYNIDLGSQQQIRQQADAIRRKYPAIDVLINNAGIWTSRYERTEDGIERQFAVNHLAYFLLTHMLYPALARSANGRIINLGSDSHKFGKIHFEDVNLERSYHGLKAYGQSKLANLLFTYELHRRKKESHVSVYCVQPGLVKTDIGVKHTNPFHGLMWKLRRLTGMTPEAAAQTAIYLATSDEVSARSGLYWDQSKPKPSSRRSMNEEDAARLWTLSEQMCGIKSFF